MLMTGSLRQFINAYRLRIRMTSQDVSALFCHEHTPHWPPLATPLISIITIYIEKRHHIRHYYFNITFFTTQCRAKLRGRLLPLDY